LSYTELSEGEHTFWIGIYDEAGNYTEDNYSWIIDLTAPSLSIDLSPALLTNSTEATFEFSGTDDVSASDALTLFCSLDGSDWEACANALSYTELSEGEHTFWIGIYDEAGNYSEENYSWIIDLTAPVTSIDAGPATYVTSTTATWTFTGSDDVSSAENLTFQCALDGGAYQPCSSPKTYTGLAATFHRFYIKAVDEAGNIESENSYGWWVQKERALNGGLNTYAGTSKIPTSWVAANFATTDGKDITFKKEGTASVKIAGQLGKTKTLTQNLALSGISGDKLTFSFWAKGASIPTAGVCKAEVLLYNGATLKQTKFINCSTGTYATFQAKTLIFNATSAYTKVVIKFTYANASGTVWFDAVSLVK
jgi:hypothetical protein